MPHPLIQVNAFTDTPFAGNPAGVGLLDGPADEAPPDDTGTVGGGGGSQGQVQARAAFRRVCGSQFRCAKRSPCPWWRKSGVGAFVRVRKISVFCEGYVKLPPCQCFFNTPRKKFNHIFNLFRATLKTF